MRKLLFVMFTAFVLLAVGCTTELAEAPTISEQAVSNSKQITITTSVKKASIRYTLDGTDPTVDSQTYSSPITVSQNTTVKAVAVKGKRLVSEVATYEVHFQLTAPTANLAAGAYLFSQTVTLSCPSDCTIRYTTNGTSPNVDSTEYTGPITVSQTMTIKAITVKAGYDNSDVLELTYEIGYKNGAIGPAGGYVFYDCDADNDSGNADDLKSSECGWRYLEAAPSDITVSDTSTFIFGYYRQTSDGTILYVNDSTSYVVGTSDASDGKCTGTAIGTGRANTTKLLAKMGSAAYTGSSGTGTTPNYAARLCDDYTYGGYSDWFLPSKDELNLMYTTLESNDLGSFASEFYWSSTEDFSRMDLAKSQYFGSGGSQSHFYRYGNYRVRAVRAFLTADDSAPSAPTASVSSGTYSSAQTVELECTDDNATIYYTLDGTNPIFNGTEYTDELTISYDTCIPQTVVKAVAKDSYGQYSDVVEYTYVILGPAGGYVFYDCDADNASGNDDGLTSTTCGWRYLEAAPANITVDSTSTFVFGYYRTTSDGTNLYVNDSTTYVVGTSDASDGKSTGTAIGTGKANTTKLVPKMGSAAYSSSSGTSTKANYAAKLCDDYTYGGSSDWFLPSKDELNLMYTNLNSKSLGNLVSGYYWSSSEGSNYAYYAWYQDFGNGGQYSTYRGNFYRVRAVRAF